MSFDEILSLTHLDAVKDITTNNLSLPDKKNVEIARALACNPEIILFDEVSCGLSGEEIRERMKLMKKLADQGITIIVIEHIMMFIKEICDRVVVLHAGELIAQGTPAEIMRGETLEMIYGIPMGVILNITMYMLVIQKR